MSFGTNGTSTYFRHLTRNVGGYISGQILTLLIISFLSKILHSDWFKIRNVQKLAEIHPESIGGELFTWSQKTSIMFSFLWLASRSSCHYAISELRAKLELHADSNYPEKTEKIQKVKRVLSGLTWCNFPKFLHQNCIPKRSNFSIF